MKTFWTSKNFYYGIVLNSIFVGIFSYLYSKGVVTTALQNDALFIIPAITVVFLLGLLGVMFNSKLTPWFADTTVGLGFLGTLYGIWLAFSGLKLEHISDISALIPILAQLITGIGVAIWTTIAGMFFFTWLTANIELFGDKDT